MRAHVFVIALLTASIVSCNNPGTSSRYTGGDALPSTIIEIDPSHDTTVTTPGGAIVKIPQGALDGGGAATIRLEVKEAYLLEDMIRGKLFTRSEDQLLSSGGMIYINAAAGQTVTIRQPISVKIPTDEIVHGMMVYDGQVDTGGSVHWVDPRPLSEDTGSGTVSAGKEIFQINCASCHAIKGVVTAPALAWITGRRDKKWLADFTRNSARMLWRGDAYSCFLFNRWNKTPMPVYPNLSDADVDAVYSYISQASRGVDSNSIPDEKRTFDSCSQSDPYCNGAPARTSSDYTQPKTDVSSASVGGSGAGVGAPGSSYYGFTIAKFGWSNIDILLKDLPGVQESDLLVRVKGGNQEKMEVFLGIPKLKVLEKGTFTTDKNGYCFYTPDGRIPLPQGVDAYVIVRSENESQAMFGKTKWIIGKQQFLSPELKAMTQEEIDHAIHQLPFDSADLASATAWDTTGGSTDSAATANGAGVSDGGSRVGSGDGGSANAAGTDGGNGSSSRAVTRKRRLARPQPSQSCPCWCDEMDYRKADSIARATNMRQH